MGGILFKQGDNIPTGFSGGHGGRPKSLNHKKVALMRKLYEQKQHTVKEICEIIGITKPYLYDYLNDRHKRK